MPKAARCLHPLQLRLWSDTDLPPRGEPPFRERRKRAARATVAQQLALWEEEIPDGETPAEVAATLPPLEPLELKPLDTEAAAEGGREAWRAWARQHPTLTHDDIMALGARIKAGDVEAADRLAMCCLHVAITDASRAADHFGAEFDDIISETVDELRRAARNFDGAGAFIPYARRWTAPFARRAAEKAAVHGRSALTVPSSDIRQARTQQNKLKKGETVEGELIVLPATAAQLDAPTEDGHTLADTIAAEEQDTSAPEDAVRMLRLLLPCLSDRQRAVITGLFALDGREATTQMLGRELGVAETSVRRIRDEALNRMSAEALRLGLSWP